MAIVEKQTDTLQNQEEDENKVFYRVYPQIYRRINHEEKTIQLEVSLPGVKKDAIKLKDKVEVLPVGKKTKSIDDSPREI